MVEIRFIMVSAFFSFLLGIGAYIMYPLCRQDVLIAMLMGIIITYPAFRIVRFIIKNNYYEDIFELNKSVGYIGRMLNFLLFIGLCVISLFLLYNVSDFLNIEYFSESSVGFTKFLVLVPIFYILTKDIKTILKMNQIVAIICIVILYLLKKITLKYNLLIILFTFFSYSLVGFIDDYLIVKKNNNKGLSEISKLIMQIIIAIIFFYLFLLNK